MYNNRPYEMIYTINGSRRKVLVASIMEMQAMYESMGSEVYVLTVEPKGLGQRFEER